MHRLVAVLAAAALALALPTIAVADDGSAAPGTLLAGIGVADATWHVGAGGGQYTAKYLPVSFGDNEVVVMRFDDVSGDEPEPLAVWAPEPPRR